jgi:hypothetical protein
MSSVSCPKATDTHGSRPDLSRRLSRSSGRRAHRRNKRGQPAIVINPVDTNIIFAVTTGGLLFRSNNRGLSAIGGPIANIATFGEPSGGRVAGAYRQSCRFHSLLRDLACVYEQGSRCNVDADRNHRPDKRWPGPHYTASEQRRVMVSSDGGAA